MKNFLIGLALVFIAVNAPYQLVAQEATSDTTMIQKPQKPKAPEPQKPTSPELSKRTFGVGLMGGAVVAMNSLNETTIPIVPTCCAGYESSSGSGFVFGVVGDLPLSENFDITTRLMYEASSVDLTATEPITVRDGNGTKQSTITHENTSSFSMFNIEPGVEWRFAGGFGLVGGLRLGFLMNATYDQQEVLDPSIPYDYAFEQTGVRNQSSGDITNTSSTQFGIFVGLRYRLALNPRKTIELIPEIQYAPLFTDVITTDTWSISSLRFMLGVSYNFFSKSNANPLEPEG